jgi:O-methyltransferase
MRAFLKAHQVKDRRVFACDTFRSFRPKLPPQPILAIAQALAAIPGRSWRRWYFHFLERCNKDPSFPKAENPSDDWIDLTLWQLRHSEVLTNLPDNSLELVQSRFACYGLLDEQVLLLQGFFADTLPKAPIEQLAVLRLDGDTYESTIQPLTILYPKLSVGGSCIVDDYHTFEACRQAVDEYRATHGIADELIEIDANGVYWRKS